MNRQFGRITERALAELRQEGFAGEPEIQRAINMRYFGQNYEHEVEIEPGELDEAALERAFRRFDELHAERYGYAIDGEVIELVSFKVTAIGKRAPLDLSRANGATAFARSERPVYVRGQGSLDATVAHRSSLEPGEVIAGPAVIEEEGSTLFVEPGMTVERTAQGALVIQTGATRMTTTTFDPVALTMVDNYLTSCCRDMGVTMMTTAYSPIFNESLDFSCVIFDPTGNMLAQAEFCPSQIGTIKFTVEWTIEELGLDAFEQGDVVLHNDPYRGSGHVPEHMLLKPVFWEGEIVAFVANVAHMSEVGAKTPGGLSGDATEVYQEGLLLPPVKIKRRGEDVDDVWKIILSNHRTPRVTLGDFRAMMGSLDLAERRIHTLIEDYGLDFFQATSAELMAIAERRMRAEIEAIPDGVYTFSDAIEDDGITDRDYPIELTLTIDGGEVIADFTGSAEQAVGPVNAIYAVTASAIYNAFLHLDRPDDPPQRGLLPAVHDHRAARHDRELLLPGAGRGRQHRDEPAHHRHGLRRAAGRDPGSGRRLVRRHLVAVPLRRHRPAHGRAVRALPLRGRRLGRAPAASTATTWSSRSTATAATRPSRSSRRATRRSGSSRTGSCPTRAARASSAAASAASGSSP